MVNEEKKEKDEHLIELSQIMVNREEEENNIQETSLTSVDQPSDIENEEPEDLEYYQDSSTDSEAEDISEQQIEKCTFFRNHNKFIFFSLKFSFAIN